MSLTQDDVAKILRIVDESGYDDIHLEIGEFKLHVQKHRAGFSDSQQPSSQFNGAAGAPQFARADSAMAPSVRSAVPPQANTRKDQPIPEGWIAVRAPMLGVFYRSPSPGEKPFAEVGHLVGAEDTVCLIEVMKLFNSIKASVNGTVRTILVENGAMVEHDEPLILIEPSE